MALLSGAQRPTNTAKAKPMGVVDAMEFARHNVRAQRFCPSSLVRDPVQNLAFNFTETNVCGY